MSSVSRSDSILQRLLGQTVDALALRLSRDGKLLVQPGGNSQVELAREMAPWRYALFLAHVEEDLELIPELDAAFLGVLAVEIGAAAESKNLAPEEVEFLVVFDPGVIAGYRHHVHGSTQDSSPAVEAHEKADVASG